MTDLRLKYFQNTVRPVVKDVDANSLNSNEAPYFLMIIWNTENEKFRITGQIVIVTRLFQIFEKTLR